jgi:hypothetical protein
VKAFRALTLLASGNGETDIVALVSPVDTDEGGARLWPRFARDPAAERQIVIQTHVVRRKRWRGVRRVLTCTRRPANPAMSASNFSAICSARRPLGVALLAFACSGRLGGDSSVAPVRTDPQPEPSRPGLSASARALDVALPALGACVAYPGDIERSFDIHGPDLEFGGLVLERGSGVAEPWGDGGCPLVGGGDRRAFGAGSLSIDDVPELAQTSWLRLQAANDGEVVLAVVASGFAFPSDLGAADFKLHTEPIGFSPVRNWLEVRDEGGHLVLWIGTAGSVEALEPPAELELRRGDVESTRSSECIGSWNVHQLRASADGSEVSITDRRRAPVGAWQVTNGGVEIQTGASHCPDVFVASARAAIWPRSSAIPIGSGIGGACDPTWFVPGSTVDRNLVCQVGEQFPDGYLTLACTNDMDCPAESRCDGAFCRLP